MVSIYRTKYRQKSLRKPHHDKGVRKIVFHIKPTVLCNILHISTCLPEDIFSKQRLYLIELLFRQKIPFTFVNGMFLSKWWVRRGSFFSESISLFKRTLASKNALPKKPNRWLFTESPLCGRCGRLRFLTPPEVSKFATKNPLSGAFE